MVQEEQTLLELHVAQAVSRDRHVLHTELLRVYPVAQLWQLDAEEHVRQLDIVVLQAWHRLLEFRM